MCGQIEGEEFKDGGGGGGRGGIEVQEAQRQRRILSDQF